MARVKPTGFKGLFKDAYGFRPWAIITGIVLLCVVVGAFLTLAISDDSNTPPATVYLTDGRVAECSSSYWFGGGFGGDNKFKCDGITYTITVIDHVEVHD